MVNIPRTCAARHGLALMFTRKTHESPAAAKTVSGNKLTLNSLLFKGFAELKPGGLAAGY